MVALPRVAIFANRFTVPGPQGWPFNPWDALGVLFALGLGLSIYTFSYFSSMAEVDEDEEEEKGWSDLTPYQKGKRRLRRKKEVAAARARVGGILFAVFDGLFNLAEVSSVAIANEDIVSLTWPRNSDWIALVAVWIFGLAPTLASFIAGWVRAAVEKVPERKDKDEPLTKLYRSIMGWLAGKFDTKPKRKHTPTTRAKKARSKKKSNSRTKYPEFKGMMAGKTRDDVSAPEIADKLGVSNKTIYRYLNRLEEERNGSED